MDTRNTRICHPARWSEANATQVRMAKGLASLSKSLV
jgi:hypothetical protein